MSSLTPSVKIQYMVMMFISPFHERHVTYNATLLDWERKEREKKKPNHLKKLL